MLKTRAVREERRDPCASPNRAAPALEAGSQSWRVQLGEEQTCGQLPTIEKKKDDLEIKDCSSELQGPSTGSLHIQLLSTSRICLIVGISPKLVSTMITILPQTMIPLMPQIKLFLTADDTQEKATYKGTCRNTDMAMTLDKMPENAEFLEGQGINSETLPEISNASISDEAVIKNIILRYVKNSWPKEQAPELSDLLNRNRDGKSSKKPSCSPTTMKENTSGLEEPAHAGRSRHQDNSDFLTKIKSLSDKQKSVQGKAPQKQHSEKASSGNRFNYGPGQNYWFSHFSERKIPKNNLIDKPLTIDKQASFSPTLRDKSAIVQDILESMPKSNCVEKQEQKWKTIEPLQMKVRVGAETSLLKLSSTSQKDPSSSSSFIFQKISQGKQMCQKLKEQTDQLKTKDILLKLIMNNRSTRIFQSVTLDFPYHLQDTRLGHGKQERITAKGNKLRVLELEMRKVSALLRVLEKPHGHLELLEQECLHKKEKYRTLKHHDSTAVCDSGPGRKIEGEIFKLEMLLEDAKEKINKGKYTSAVSLPMSSPVILDDSASVSSPPSNEK
ncbi:hypothetical protein MC885_004698 [Smutsia gigantea]|nr:hypothetical protein MC885_004698 [Smutsia gigantea]